MKRKVNFLRSKRKIKASTFLKQNKKYLSTLKKNQHQSTERTKVIKLITLQQPSVFLKILRSRRNKTDDSTTAEKPKNPNPHVNFLLIKF